MNPQSLGLVIGAVAIAIIVAIIVSRRRPEAPAAPVHTVPRQLDRADFSRPDAPWLVAVFTSSTCSTCANVWERAEVLDSSYVATQEIEYTRDRELHERYEINAVPTLVIADDAGVAQRWFLGPVNSTDLWAAMAEVRDPGSTPEGCRTTDS